MTGVQQLENVRAALDEADARATALATSCLPAHWQRRAADGGWSPSECMQHIVLSVDAMLVGLDQAIAAGQAAGTRGTGPYRAGLLGRVLLWSLEPPYRRLRTRTGRAFIPAEPQAPETDLGAMIAAHDGARASLDRARGLALDRLSITSPFDARVSYNLYAAFALLPIHARRHLWQAGQSLLSHADAPTATPSAE